MAHPVPPPTLSPQTIRPLPEALARLPFLHGAPAAALANFAAASRWVEAGPGDAVIDFDEGSTDVFLVLTGCLRVLVRTADGRHTQIIGDMAAGDLVGELSAIDHAPRSARVEALVVSRLCIVPAGAFLALAFAAPEVGARLMRRLAAKIRGQTYRLLESAVLPTRMRLAAELLRLSRPRPNGTRVLTPPPTHEELAARIGTRRETVSRELSALSRAGFVRRARASIVLTEPDTLRALVDAGLEQPAARFDEAARAT